MQTIPYLVGNKRIEDHTYWPIVSRAMLVADGWSDDDILTYWPIGFTKQQFLFITWHIREWRMTFDFSATLANDDDGGNHFYEMGCSTNAAVDNWARYYRYARGLAPYTDPYTEVANEQELLGYLSFWNQTLSDTTGFHYQNPRLSHGLRPAGMNSRKDLVVRHMTYYRYGQPDPDYPPDPSDPPDPNYPPPPWVMTDVDSTELAVTTANLSYGFDSGTVLYDPVSNLFYPQFVISASFTAPGASEAAGTTIIHDVLFNVQPGPNYFYTYTPTITGDLTMEFGPVASLVIPMKIHTAEIVTNFGFPHEPTTSTLSGTFSMTMTPTKWWPYKNRAGLPVYEENTGVKINDYK